MDTSPWWYVNVAQWSLLRGVTIICFPVNTIRKNISFINALLIKSLAMNYYYFYEYFPHNYVLACSVDFLKY